MEYKVKDIMELVPPNTFVQFDIDTVSFSVKDFLNIIKKTKENVFRKVGDIKIASKNIRLKDLEEFKKLKKQ